MTRNVIFRYLFPAVLAGITIFHGSFATQVLAQDQVVIELFGRGIHSYYRGEYESALESLDLAIEQGSVDPRYYYFRGLAKFALDQKDEADADFEQGATLELNATRSYPIGQSLERIQGAARLKLEEHRQTVRVKQYLKKKAWEQARYESLKRAEEEVVRKRVEKASANIVATPDAPDANDPFANADTTVSEPMAIEAEVSPANTQPAANDPFGGTPAPAASDPFGGTPAPVTPAPAASDPFGGTPAPAPATPAPAASDPFGGTPAPAPATPAPAATPPATPAPAASDPFGAAPAPDAATPPATPAPAASDPFGAAPAADAATPPATPAPAASDPFGAAPAADAATPPPAPAASDPFGAAPAADAATPPATPAPAASDPFGAAPAADAATPPATPAPAASDPFGAAPAADAADDPFAN